jgi:TonB family protein
MAKGISRSMPQLAQDELFSLLPYRRPPWGQFLFSLVTQATLIVGLLWVGVLHPEILIPPPHDYQAIALVSTPVPVNHDPAPLTVLKPDYSPPPDPRPAEALQVPRPEVKALPDPPAAPKIEVAAKPQTLPAIAPAVPRRLVHTDSFSTGSSATPTIAQAPKNVQTGGFGDPNGVPARPNDGKPVNIAQTGSFDLPQGPGYGNGTGGALGSPGVVASAGFGNETAIGDGTGSLHTTRGTVRQSGFGDAETATAASLQPKPDLASEIMPAEVTFKPNPVYTSEAKQLRIQGEVLLQVVFESSGKLRVLRVIRGLGHGLDEAAVRAAEQIRFKPALRDGQPADSTAVLHIVFQLA